LILFTFEEQTMGSKKWILIITIIILLFSGCDQTTENRYKVGAEQKVNQTWIDFPLMNSTLPLGSYLIQFHGAVQSAPCGFDVLINDDLHSTVSPILELSDKNLIYGEVSWTPNTHGNFQIEVRTICQNIPDSSAFVNIFIQGDDKVESTEDIPALEISETKTPFPSATLAPTNTPTVTLSPTLSPTPQRPLVHVTRDTFCRLGPGYPPLGILEVGEKAEIFARDFWTNYWFIENPTDPGVECWIWSAYATPEGSTEGLPIYTPHPTFTPTQELSCSGYTTQGACEEAGCTWVVGMAQGQCKE
jgi:hypothetical protein